MSARNTFLYLSSVAFLAFSIAEPVSFIKKCKLADGNCIKEQVQVSLPIFAAGLKEYGVESVDPLVVPKFDASTTGLKLIVTDAVFTGLKDCEVKKFTHDPEKNQLIGKVLCDINLEGQYDMSGRLLIVSIEGNGPVHAKLRKLELSVDINLEDKVKNGKKYWHIKSVTHNYDLKDKADLEFENLFNGNEVLSRTARELIATNGNEIVTELGPPVVKSIIEGLAKKVNKFFSKVPLEDLIDYS